MKKLILFSLLTLIIVNIKGYSNDNGDLKSPIVITTAEELQAIADDLTANYILGNDIDLTGFEWISIMDFEGEFDGDGHIITGLFVVNEDTKAGAIFGKILEGSLVKNVGVVDAYVVSGWYATTLVGDVWGEVRNCYSTGFVECVIPEDGTYVGNVGGLVGNVRPPGKVYNCYSTCDMELDGSHGSQGGMVGNVSGWIENCYYAGEIDDAEDFQDLIGGFCGTYYDTIMEDVLYSCYYDHDLTELEGPLGEDTDDMWEENTFEDWDFETIWSIVEDVSYPTLRVFETNTAINDIEKISNIHIYPNPATNRLHINLNVNTALAKIYNTNSKLIKEVSLSAFESVIEINDLPSGMYILNISSDNTNKAIKFIKE